ncbi:MAG: virulence factor [Anaerolineae bacterium]
MATTYQIIYWRDIPAQVKAQAGRNRASRQLPERFERAIDRAAMHAGAINTDDYLAEWRKTEWMEREGEPEAVVEAIVAELDAAYPEDKLREMSRNGGREAKVE